MMPLKSGTKMKLNNIVFENEFNCYNDLIRRCQAKWAKNKVIMRKMKEEKNDVEINMKNGPICLIFRKIKLLTLINDLVFKDCKNGD